MSRGLCIAPGIHTAVMLTAFSAASRKTALVRAQQSRLNRQKAEEGQQQQ